MARYRFTLAAGNEYGASVSLRVARSSLDGQRMLSADRFSTVNITDGTALDTIDPVTIAILDQWVGVGKAGRGVTVESGRAGTRTVNYDTATDAQRS